MSIAVITRDPVLLSFLERPLAPLGQRLHAIPDLAGIDALRQPQPRAADRDDAPAAPASPRAVLLPRRLPGDAGPADAALRGAVASVRERLGPDVPIIVIGLEAGDHDQARAAGADGFLLVPFSDEDVLAVLGTAARERKLVLLADDSLLIHRHTVPILEGAGYDVISAMDGDQALAACRDRRPDLVITDVEMPGRDGYALCKAIKESWPHLPVLISSTLGEAADLERGFDAGADDYLVKPVIPEELLTRVRALFPMPGSRERILVVDDSPAQRHYVADCLARQGFAVLTAGDGRAGLAEARRHLPALIISDYEMPEMTGFELVHALKREPETRNIPVIMLTARDSKRDMAQMRAAGASAYLIKPFAQDKCVALVERTLAERRLRDYKQASSLYISEGARQAAEERVRAGDLDATRADEREVTVLFTDLVGFTSLSATMGPRQVIDLLNDYFDRLCPLIQAEGGDIDKFIGDAIMAVFDDEPGQVPGHGPGQAPGSDAAAVRAVRTGLAMQAAMAQLDAGRPVPLRMRIGINTGPVVRGDMGARSVRRDYTVVGDTVNRAQRHESACPPGGVLISGSTRAALGDMVTVETVPGLRFKGVDAPVTAYLVRAMRQEPSDG